ncbi:MAG: NnrS family protein [Myxococcota bacterium]
MTDSTAILQKGFRPFFLLAAFFSAVYLPIWLLLLDGGLQVETAWSRATWHGHEMLYGFTIAVVAGFLLTAVANWTRQETATGGLLGLLAALWILGRLAVGASGWLPPWLVAIADLAFIPALAVVLGRCLVGTKNRRNYVFLIVLTALWVANLIMHLDALGFVEGWARPALIAAVDLVIIIVLIVGGRIIPAFTRNATGDDSIRKHTWIEYSLFPAVIGGSIAWQVAPGSSVAGVLTVAAGVLALVRMTHWGFGKTLRAPILWVLHVGYAWIGVGFILRGLSSFVSILPSSATHALTAGAIGTLTLGMMARVARGHTARELRVERVTAAAFVVISLAAIIRVAVPVLTPNLYMAGMIASGVLWSLAFTMYLAKFTPILWQPRVDGRPG